MFLSDKDIKELMTSKKIIVKPSLDPSNIRSVGVRAHLNETILIAQPGQTLDLKNPHELSYIKHSLKEKPFTIEPGQFILASTLEKIQLDRSLIAFIDGRSTIARLGLTVHLSSATLDGNYEEPRATTLEMKNHGNISITLNYKDPVGMILFAQLVSPVAQKPQSQYAGQEDTAAPNVGFRTGKDQ